MGLFGPKEYKPENPVKSIRQVSTDTQDIQKEIDTGSALSRKFLIVDDLPDTGVTDTIYLVPKENTRKGGTQEIYDEYIYIEETGKFERIGSTEIDLSGYAKKTDLFDYSTDEQVVGKWIDGKPLYQRTFSGNTGTVLDTETVINIATLTNGEEIKTFDGIVGWGNSSYGGLADIPYFRAYNNFITLATVNNVMSLYICGNYYSNNPYYITIRYTKSTD